MPDPSDAHLLVEEVTLRFGGTVALDGVSLQFPRGAVIGVVGPNGAGKSSLLNCINGFYRPQHGRIAFEGSELVGMRPHRIARLGIARTFQNIELSREATVVANIMLGCHIHMSTDLLSAGLYWGRGRNQEILARHRVEKVIEFLEIERLRKRPVGSLSYGQQKLVEIGRSIVSEPRLLLLDEPTSGMNREEKEDVARFIVRMREEIGLTQVLIEHDLRFVADLCDHLFVLDFGQVIGEGSPEEVMADPRVIEAYVGTASAPAPPIPATVGEGGRAGDSSLC